MPWCATCDRFLSPSTVKVDGTCPMCGRTVEPGRARTAELESPVDVPEEAGEDEEPLDPIPWHLKLLAGALALYLGYRAWQGIEWLAHQF